MRKNACQADLNGGQCIADDEMLTHHTSQRGRYNSAPRSEVMEVELSMMRGELTVAEACMRRNGGRTAHPSDVERADVRYTTAGKLRTAGFAVVFTRPGRERAMATLPSSGRPPTRSTSQTLPGRQKCKRSSRRALLKTRNDDDEPRHASARRSAAVAPCADG